MSLLASVLNNEYNNFVIKNFQEITIFLISCHFLIKFL